MRELGYPGSRLFVRDILRGGHELSIQWYPGHMAKAAREVTESLKIVDVIIEVLDSRLPESSRNPMMATKLQNKPTVLALAKADMADPVITERFVREYNRRPDMQAVAIDSLHGGGIKELISSATALAQPKLQKLAAKGIHRDTVRALVIGIPNAGKSTLINRLAKRNAVKTGDKPGVTRQKQWIRVGKSFELLDTPGILWPKFEDRNVALRLAWSGAIAQTLLPLEELAQELIEWLRIAYPEQLQERYRFIDLKGTADQLFAHIAVERGALLPGGLPDLHQGAEKLLRDVQTGKLGRISFDRLE